MIGEKTFRPTDSWRWYFDPQYDCLMLELSNEIVFRSYYPSKMLIPDVFTDFPFTVSHAAIYYQFYDNSQYLNLSESKRIELTINAIVAANFLKPQMPKSWYFLPSQTFFQPNFADIVKVNLQNNTTVNLMVVEAAENASLCVIAQPSFIASNKTFYFSETIKVMNDRLTPFHYDYLQDHQSADLAAIS